MTDTPDTPPEEAGQSLMSHLLELRTRLLKAAGTILLVMLVLVPFARQLYGWLSRPLLAHLPDGGSMIATDVISPFFTPLKLVFFVAVLAAMPVVLYQMWAFVSPGLYRHERRLAVPLLVSSVALFYTGVAFAYYLVLPAVFAFTTAMAPEGVTVMPDIARFLDFAVLLFLAFGFCFEVPVALIILVALGVVTPDRLVEIRPYAVIGAFVIGALLSPPDVLSMFLLAVPMYLLYEAGIVAARLLGRTPVDGDKRAS